MVETGERQRDIPLMDSPNVKSAQGHVAHLEALIREWTHRRDEGDFVPSKELLTDWIRQVESELERWKRELALAEMVPPTVG